MWRDNGGIGNDYYGRGEIGGVIEAMAEKIIFSWDSWIISTQKWWGIASLTKD